MTEPAPSNPPARRLRLRDAIIAAVVLINIALPVSYYVGRSDSPLAPFDERFAWRMFSPVRMAKCQVAIYDATDGSKAPINLQRQIHVVWINLLKRARPAVVEAALDKFCDEAGEGADIRMDLICTAPEAAALTICEGAADRDRDGIPDAYAVGHYCDGDPAKCFAEECGEKSADACYRERCRVALLTPDRNQCADREAI